MKNKFSFYNENVYTETLSNGLEVIIIPNRKVKDKFVTFTTKYGGVNYEFKFNNKYVKVPNGIAHFLEHKVFEQKDGLDPFTFYNTTGTYSNAFTNYFNTTYVFAGNKSFNKNLRYLLDFVQSPYFTDENVKKEKGIITEEIKMYDDMPDNILYERLLYNLFVNNPVRYSISGTVSDINKITKEDLYNCYNTFYNPSNMFLVISGNVNITDTINLIKENQNKKEFKKVDIKVKKVDEPNEVYKGKEIISKPVAIPYVSYGIKIPINKFKIDRKKLNLYLSTIFDVLFDETSIFYEKMKDENLINSSIDIDTLDTDTHKAFMISFKSKNYDIVIDEIDKVLEHINISNDDIERKKKVNISNMSFAFDDISLINKIVLNNKVIYDNICLNTYDTIKSMNKEELDMIISKLDLTNKSILIIKDN